MIADARMDESSVVAASGAGIDLYVGGSRATAECVSEGIVLRPSYGGDNVVIKTEEPPESGRPAFARTPLSRFHGSSLVDEVRIGGGACQSLSTYAALHRQSGRGPNNFQLISSSEATDGLVSSLADAGITPWFLGRHRPPLQLIVNIEDQRVVVEERLEPPAYELSPGDIELVRKSVAGARSVLTVSARDAAVNAAVIGVSNSAYRYCQLTPCLSCEANLVMAAVADEIINDFAEWHCFAKFMGISVPAADEDDPLAFEIAARLLEEVHARRLAGREAAVCTLGRRGAVAADWDRGQLYKIALTIIDGTNGVPSPARVGDVFFGAYAYFRDSWARQGYLRDPVAAAAQKSVHHVAMCIGLRGDRYNLRTKII